MGLYGASALAFDLRRQGETRAATRAARWVHAQPIQGRWVQLETSGGSGNPTADFDVLRERHAGKSAIRQVSSQPPTAIVLDAKRHNGGVQLIAMDSSDQLNEQFMRWLVAMKDGHPKLRVAELARRIGIAAEVYYRGDARPGVFNADTLQKMQAAMGVPAWLILQSIQEGRIILVYRASEATG